MPDPRKEDILAALRQSEAENDKFRILLQEKELQVRELEAIIRKEGHNHEVDAQEYDDCAACFLRSREKRNDETEPRHCVKCGAQVEKGEAAHPYACIGKGNAANPAPFHDCVGVRYCAICNVRL